jgi:protein-disulfide isomerase
MKQNNSFYKLYFFGTLILSLSFTIFGQELGANPAWQRGNSSAKYTFEVFNDYQCPACVGANEKIKELQNKYPNDVLIIFRHYPLTQIHKIAMLAAQAAEAAGRQGKFWEMNDLLFLKQEKWSKSKSPEKVFVGYAKKLNLSPEIFRNDLRSEESVERINLDVKRAKFLKVNAIPNVIFNGEELSFEKLSNLEEIILLQEIK